MGGGDIRCVSLVWGLALPFAGPRWQDVSHHTPCSDAGAPALSPLCHKEDELPHLLQDFMFWREGHKKLVTPGWEMDVGHWVMDGVVLVGSPGWG